MHNVTLRLNHFLRRHTTLSKTLAIAIEFTICLLVFILLVRAYTITKWPKEALLVAFFNGFNESEVAYFFSELAVMFVTVIGVLLYLLLKRIKLKNGLPLWIPFLKS